MAHEITVPSFGESISESTVAQWLKADGDYVRKGETLVVLDTEKTSSDLQADTDGKLHIKAAAGSDVKIGAVIGEIDDTAAPPAESAEEKPIPPVPSPGAAPAPISSKPETLTTERSEAEQQPSAKPGNAEMEATALGGSGVEKNLGAATNGDQPESREPMTRLRRTLAQHLLKARNETAMLTSFTEVDMSGVLDIRARHQEMFQKHHGVKLGFMSFFIKATIEALRQFPLINASIDGNDIVHHNFFNISVAVSTDRGLVVPVIRDADKKSFAEIETELTNLANRARENKIALEELNGGTFTITNGGVFGSMLSTPLLNPPQVGILGMHAITDRPVAVDGKVVIRPMMYLALSYDHRLIDGRDAVQFLVRVRDYVAAPERVLLGL